MALGALLTKKEGHKNDPKKNKKIRYIKNCDEKMEKVGARSAHFRQEHLTTCIVTYMFIYTFRLTKSY